MVFLNISQCKDRPTNMAKHYIVIDNCYTILTLRGKGELSYIHSKIFYVIIYSKSKIYFLDYSISISIKFLH